MSKRIRAFAPATVANVCCGFDVLGFALDAPGDEVEVTFTDRPGVTISKITGDNGNLPTDPKINTAGVSVQAMLDHVQFDGGIDIILEKNMPLFSGLGSSAASAVAASVAVNTADLEFGKYPISPSNSSRSSMTGYSLSSARSRQEPPI